MERSFQQKASYYDQLLRFTNKQLETLEEKITLNQATLQVRDFKEQTKIRATIIQDQEKQQKLVTEKTLILLILDTLSTVSTLMNNESKKTPWSYFFKSSSKELTKQQKLLQTYEDSYTKLSQKLHITKSNHTQNQNSLQTRLKQTKPAEGSLSTSLNLHKSKSSQQR